MDPDPAGARRGGRVLIALLLAGCQLPTFDDLPRQGMMALDTTVDRLQVIGVRTVPALAPVGEPRRLEALVVAPGGTRRDVTLGYRTCGLSETASVGITDLRCFDNPELVTDLGDGGDLWQVPEIAFPDCIPYDAVPTAPDLPGSGCQSVVPLLVEAVDEDGQVALGANYVALPISEIPPRLSIDVEGAIVEMPTRQYLQLSRADPELAVSLTASEPDGGRVELEVTLEDPHYDRVAWWVDGGTLDQSGRTVITRSPDGIGHAYNRWILPSERTAPLTVWVVLTEWSNTGGDIPFPGTTMVSQPAWAELTLEVEP